MNLDEFIKLSIKEQASSICTEAIILATRNDNVYDYVLYQFHSFYIEKKFSNIDRKLIGIYAFDVSCEILDMYLSKIKLIL